MARYTKVGIQDPEFAYPNRVQMVGVGGNTFDMIPARGNKGNSQAQPISGANMEGIENGLVAIDNALATVERDKVKTVNSIGVTSGTTNVLIEAKDIDTDGGYTAAQSVQGAFDDLYINKQDINEPTLTTAVKTIPGGINELQSEINTHETRLDSVEDLMVKKINENLPDSAGSVAVNEFSGLFTGYMSGYAGARSAVLGNVGSNDNGLLVYDKAGVLKGGYTYQEDTDKLQLNLNNADISSDIFAPNYGQVKAYTDGEVAIVQADVDAEGVRNDTQDNVISSLTGKFDELTTNAVLESRKLTLTAMPTTATNINLYDNRQEKVGYNPLLLDYKAGSTHIVLFKAIGDYTVNFTLEAMHTNTSNTTVYVEMFVNGVLNKSTSRSLSGGNGEIIGMNGSFTYSKTTEGDTEVYFTYRASQGNTSTDSANVNISLSSNVTSTIPTVDSDHVNIIGTGGALDGTTLTYAVDKFAQTINGNTVTDGVAHVNESQTGFTVFDTGYTGTKATYSGTSGTNRGYYAYKADNSVAFQITHNRTDGSNYMSLPNAVITNDNNVANYGQVKSYVNAEKLVLDFADIGFDPATASTTSFELNLESIFDKATAFAGSKPWIVRDEIYNEVYAFGASFVAHNNSLIQFEDIVDLPTSYFEAKVLHKSSGNYNADMQVDISDSNGTLFARRLHTKLNPLVISSHKSTMGALNENAMLQGRVVQSTDVPANGTVFTVKEVVTKFRNRVLSISNSQALKFATPVTGQGGTIEVFSGEVTNTSSTMRFTSLNDETYFYREAYSNANGGTALMNEKNWIPIHGNLDGVKHIIPATALTGTDFEVDAHKIISDAKSIFPETGCTVQYICYGDTGTDDASKLLKSFKTSINADAGWEDLVLGATVQYLIKFELSPANITSEHLFEVHELDTGRKWFGKFEGDNNTTAVFWDDIVSESGKHGNTKEYYSAALTSSLTRMTLKFPRPLTQGSRIEITYEYDSTDGNTTTGYAANTYFYEDVNLATNIPWDGVGSTNAYQGGEFVIISSYTHENTSPIPTILSKNGSGSGSLKVNVTNTGVRGQWFGGDVRASGDNCVNGQGSYFNVTYKSIGGMIVDIPANMVACGVDVKVYDEYGMFVHRCVSTTSALTGDTLEEKFKDELEERLLSPQQNI